MTGDSLDDEPTLRDELRPLQEKALSRSASNLPRASVALAIKAPNQRSPGAALRAVLDVVAHAERRPSPPDPQVATTPPARPEPRNDTHPEQKPSLLPSRSDS